MLNPLGFLFLFKQFLYWNRKNKLFFQSFLSFFLIEGKIENLLFFSNFQKFEKKNQQRTNFQCFFIFSMAPQKKALALFFSCKKVFFQKQSTRNWRRIHIHRILFLFSRKLSSWQPMKLNDQSSNPLFPNCTCTSQSIQLCMKNFNFLNSFNFEKYPFLVIMFIEFWIDFEVHFSFLFSFILRKNFMDSSQRILSSVLFIYFEHSKGNLYYLFENLIASIFPSKFPKVYLDRFSFTSSSLIEKEEQRS